MRSNLRSTLTFVVGWPLSFIAIFFLVRSFVSHTGDLSIDFLHVNWLLLLVGVMCFMVYYYLRSYSWYILLKYQEHDLEVFESLFQWSFAQLKRYVPGNIWGVVGVSVHFNKKNVSKHVLASSFITEAQLVLLGGSFMALLGLPLIERVVPLKIPAGSLESTAVWVVALACIIYFFSKKIHSLIKLPHFTKYLLPTITFYQLIRLWSLIVLSFVFYGLGTFFVINATTYLDPTHLWEFVGYFVFSLLVGFLSFITPTGLGVREGVMALGLATAMSPGLAAFTALFARVVLVVGELLSLLVLYSLHRIQSSRLSVFLTWIKAHPFELLLAISYIAFVYYFSLISFLRFENYYAGRFDLGNMEQTVWNTLHGHIFEFTNPNGTNIVSRLAFHADFLLIALVPFYALWQDPRTLLLLQTLVTGAGTFFVFAIARKLGFSKPLSFVFALLFSLNPSLQRSVIYDFHAVTMATTFLLGAFYGILQKKYWLFVIFAFLAGITKEQIWAIIAIMGAYIAVIQRKYFIGIITTVLSVGICYVLIWVFIPSASGAPHFALSYYSSGEVTDSPTNLIRLFFFSPERTFELLTDSARLNYLHALFAPIGYLSLLAPFMLIFVTPDLAINLLSLKPQLYQIYYQYTAAITPFLYIAAIYGAKWLLSKFSFISPAMLVMYLVVMGLVSSYLYGPLPGAKSPNLDMITKPMPQKIVIDKLLSTIPAKYSVSTSNSLGSHVARRPYLFTLPYGWENADYIIFMLNETNAYPSLQAHKEQAQTLNKNPAYEKYYDDGIIIAFKKVGLPS